MLKRFGVKKGDRVAIYMPMVPEAAIAMLACARIGAIHSVVFAGFSSDAIRQRLHDAEAKVVITADVVRGVEGYRRGWRWKVSGGWGSERMVGLGRRVDLAM